MAEQQKRVDFQAGGNLLEYMRYIREEAKKISKESLTSAQQQSQSVREQIALIKQRFEQEQRERNKIRETILANDKLEIDKIKKQLEGGNLSVGQRMNLQNQVNQRQEGYNQTKSGLETEDRELYKLLHEILSSLKEGQGQTITSTNELMNEVLDEEQKRREQEKNKENKHPDEKVDKTTKSGFKDLFNAVMSVQNLQSLTSSARSALRTQTGYDSVTSTAEVGGKIAGGGIGLILGSILGGPIGAGIGVNIGSWLGGELAGGITEQMKRAFDAQVQLQGKIFENAGVTGGSLQNVSIGNADQLRSMGVTYQDYVGGQTEIAKRRGMTGGITYSEVIGLQKALGVQTETTYQLIDVQRMNVDAHKDTFNTITGLLKAGESKGLFPGGDRTFFGQFLQQFGQFSKELGKVQTKIDDSLVAGLLLNFNKVGGQWQLRDPRSMTNITSLNESIANPNDDIAKVINFRILRKAMPGATLDQLNEEETKGVFSKYLLKGIMQEYAHAPQGTVLTALRNRFGGQLSFDAIRELYRNRNQIAYGNADIDQILKSGGMSRGDVIGRAGELTTDPEKQMAFIQNSFATGAKEGVKAAISAITEAIENVFNRSVIKIVIDKQGNVVVENAVTAPLPLKNNTWTPKDQRTFDVTNGVYTAPSGIMYPRVRD